MRATYSGRVTAVPWLLAIAGLAVPMIGSGFIGWPFVVGWLVVLLFLWLSRPFAGADRSTRIGAGAGALFLLALLGTLGGFYLMPAVLAWLVLVLRSDRSAVHATP